MLQIPPYVAQQIADYLVTCPYKDVARLIEQLAQLRPVPQLEPPKPAEVPPALAAAAAMGE